MSGLFEVEPDVLEKYAENLRQLTGAMDTIGEYVHQYGCDKSGFTGLLMALHPVIDLVESLFGETLKFGKERLSSLADGMSAAGKVYTDRDEAIKKALEELGRELEGVPANCFPLPGVN